MLSLSSQCMREKTPLPCYVLRNSIVFLRGLRINYIFKVPLKNSSKKYGAGALWQGSVT